MFIITIEKMSSRDEANKDIKSFKFETKQEANKKKKELIKELELSKHNYHLVNYKTMLEITTNY